MNIFVRFGGGIGIKYNGRKILDTKHAKVEMSELFADLDLEIIIVGRY